MSPQQEQARAAQTIKQAVADLREGRTTLEAAKQVIDEATKRLETEIGTPRGTPRSLRYKLPDGKEIEFTDIGTVGTGNNTRLVFLQRTKQGARSALSYCAERQLSVS